MSNIQPRLGYYYALLDPATKMCIQVMATSGAAETLPENWVEIPVNDQEYLFKYYINGNWYEDAEGTIPWTSSLL